jgi:hypothetical protein
MINSMVVVLLDCAVSCPYSSCLKRGHDVQVQAIHPKRMETVISDLGGGGHFHMKQCIYDYIQEWDVNLFNFSFNYVVTIHNLHTTSHNIFFI